MSSTTKGQRVDALEKPLPTERRRSAVSKALLGLIVASALLGGIELLCRFLEPKPPWAVKLPPKTGGTFRIVACGGSTVAGEPIPEYGFVAQLESVLRKLNPGHPIEVFNLGRPSMDSEYVLRALERTVDRDVDLVLVLSGHNEFLSRPEGTERWVDSAASYLRRHLALARMIARLKPDDPRRQLERDQIMPERLEPYRRDQPWFARRLLRFRRHVERIAEVTQSHSVPLFLCTAPSNLADWPPAHRDLAWASPDPNYEADLAQLERLIRSGASNEALAFADDILRRFGEDAMVLYLKGRALCALGGVGRQSEAHSVFVRAKDLDPYPWRALSEINDAVREVGQTRHIRVVDVERLLQDQAAGGLVGFRLVADNVHPTPLGHAIIARAIAEEMQRGGLVLGPEVDLPEASDWLYTYLRSLGDEAHQHLLHELWLLKNAAYCMKTPYYDFDAARRYLEEAAQWSPRQWRVWANLATLSLLEGRREEGQSQLRKAAALKGSALDPEDRRWTPYLKEALERSGVALSGSPGGGR